MSNDDKIRLAAEALLPQDESLSAAEVRDLLREAGSDPDALQAAFAAQLPLESCAAFQALLPAYRAGTLPQPRRVLLEDHLHHCVVCRHALHPAAAPAAISAARPRARAIPVWFAAAAAVIVIAILAWGARAGVLPGQSQALATVAQSSGTVFAVSGASVRPVAAGTVLPSGAEVRTGTAQGAELQLRSGTQLELARRTDVLLQRGWTGTTVHLLHGNLIVRASDHGWARRLSIATADSRITDQGTVFAVAHGLMGSRVAVAQGSVAFRYERGGQNYTETVLAGHEATSNPRLGLVPMRDAFDWSQNAGQYLAMLDELTNMGKQLESLPAPPPRHQSALLSLVPAGAFVYAAIPNLNQTLTQAHSILESDLGNSPALEAWWNQPSARGGPTNGEQLESMLNNLQSLTGYLGDEIAVAAVRKPSAGVVILASVAKPGLAEQLEQPSGKGPQPRVLSNPAAAGSGRSKALLIWIGNGKLVATHNGTLLQECAALAGQPGPGPFLATPLYSKVAPLYQAGASWILAADLNQMHFGRVHKAVNPALATGSHPAFVVARSQLHSDGTPSYVQVDFSGPRTGLFGILAAPGPMGGLQFLSPNATMAVSFLTESPAQIIALLHGNHHHAQPAKPQTPEEQALSADFKNLASLLGGEFTFAQDGPVLPKPAWKAIVEVNDSQAMQNAIVQLLHDGDAAANPKHHFTLTQQSTNGNTIYSVNQNAETVLAYTYAGSYLLAGSSVAQVEDGLQTYDSGTSLPFSSQFQAQLPQNGHTNFSALFYHNVGDRLGPLAQKLLPSISPTFQPEVKALLGNATPGLTYAYASPDSIEVASTRGLLGLTLQNMLALGLSPHKNVSKGSHGHR